MYNKRAKPCISVFLAFHRIGKNDKNLNHPYLRQYFFFLAIFKVSIENNTGNNF